MSQTTPTLPAFERLLLTGAAGALGQVLREPLRRQARVLRLSDVRELSPGPQDGEEWMRCNLADGQGVDDLAEGVESILHFGAVSVERPFDEVLGANIVGTYNLYEAARRHGVRRVVYASSNHVTGFHPQGVTLDARSPRRPDGYYGISKSFGEDLASLYWDRYGIETVSLRIGSAFPEPRDRRMLHTWLSYADLQHLVERALLAPGVGHTVIYGVSANRHLWWDNHLAAHLGFAPQDSAEAYREKLEAQPPVAGDDPQAVYQGGAFTAQGPFE